MRPPRVYIATALENIAAHNKLRDLLVERGVMLSYDWTTHGPVWHLGRDACCEVSIQETEGVAYADLLVALLPGGRGTHVEIGMALGAGTPVLLHSENEDLFEINERTCAFYHHPQVRCYSGPIDEALASTIQLLLYKWRRDVFDAATKD